MDFSGFGWRDLILAGAMLAGVYLVVALLGLVRLQQRRRQAAAVADAPPVPQATESSLTAINIDIGPEPTLPPEPVLEEETPVEFVPLDFASQEAVHVPFSDHLSIAELEAEVQQLRADVKALRQELSDMKEARRVSPLYADAAALAHRGFDARGVADECGISVAEAELVLALSRDEQDFDSEVDDGGVGRAGQARDAAA